MHYQKQEIVVVKLVQFVTYGSLLLDSGTVCYLHAGSEFAVASTKVFSNSLRSRASVRTDSDIDAEKKKKIVSELRRIPKYNL